MDIEWDRKKAASNFRQHKVKYEEAVTALLDVSALVMEDMASLNEQRWILTGMSATGRLLTLVYSIRGESKIRLISARKATSKEAFYYA